MAEDTPFIDPRFLENWTPPSSISTQGGLSAVAESIAAVKFCPTRYTVFNPTNSRTALALVKDTSINQWVLHLDRPHGGHNYHHLNINSKITGIRDPHMPVSGAVVEGAGTATTVIKYVGIGALVVGIAIDAARVGVAMYNDHDEGGNVFGKRFVKTGVTAATGWGLGFAGAWGGSSLGGLIGGSIGILFGGAGAVPGAVIGNFVGGLIGGVGAGVGGAVAAGAITDVTFDFIRNKKKAFIFKIKTTSDICILMNSRRNVGDEEDETWAKQLADDWYALLAEIVALFMSTCRSSHLILLTKQPIEQMNMIENSQPNRQITHNVNRYNLHESELADISNANIRQLCKSDQFCSSQVILYSRNANDHVHDNHDFSNFLNERQETIDSVQLPAIKNQAIVMDVTGKALFWLNPNKGARDTSIFLDENIESLEIIGD